MLSNLKRAIGFSLALMAATTLAATTDAQTNAMIAQIRNDDWHIRMQGLQSIQQASYNDATVLDDQNVHVALIGLLSREIKFEDTSNSLGEEYSEYLANLLDCVASLHDQRAIEILLDRRVIVTGALATKGVAAFGDTVVTRVADQYRFSRDLDERVALLVVFDHIAESRTLLSFKNAATMRATLLSAVRDPDPLIRVPAVRGLMLYRDNFTRDALKSIAMSDSYAVAHPSGTVYPVRREAEKVLVALAAKGPKTTPN